MTAVQPAPAATTPPWPRQDAHAVLDRLRGGIPLTSAERIAVAGVLEEVLHADTVAAQHRTATARDVGTRAGLLANVLDRFHSEFEETR